MTRKEYRALHRQVEKAIKHTLVVHRQLTSVRDELYAHEHRRLKFSPGDAHERQLQAHEAAERRGA